MTRGKGDQGRSGMRPYHELVRWHPRTLAPNSNRIPTTTFSFGPLCLFGARFWFSISQPDQYGSRMALVRILVDGYSLLHNWPELAPGQPRHSAAARDELIHRLTLYRDAIITPITIFFDGAGPQPGTPAAFATPGAEVPSWREDRRA